MSLFRRSISSYCATLYIAGVAGDRKAWLRCAWLVARVVAGGGYRWRAEVGWRGAAAAQSVAASHRWRTRTYTVIQWGDSLQPRLG